MAMSQEKIASTLSADGTEMNVTLSGALSIENAAELQSALADAISGAKLVRLELHRLEHVDLTIMQVICSACRTAAAGGGQLVSDFKLPECMERFNSSIGAHVASQCSYNKGEPCLWFGGDKTCQR